MLFNNSVGWLVLDVESHEIQAWTDFVDLSWSVQRDPGCERAQNRLSSINKKSCRLQEVNCTAFMTASGGTCVPSGPILSRAPVVLYRKRMIFRKLSSPMLQEPSTRKTRSALAALQTRHTERGGGGGQEKRQSDEKEQQQQTVYSCVFSIFYLHLPSEAVLLTRTR